MHVLTLLCLLRWRRLRVASAWAILLIAILVPRLSRADDRSVAAFVGRQASGLPGLGRVAVASDHPRSLVGSGGLGYAMTEAQANEVGAHHRLAGSLAVAVQPLRFLSGALMVDGRWEKHPDDVLGSSTSSVGEPRLLLRAAQGIARSFAVGGQVDVLVPGAEAPSFRPGASRIDARALATFAPPGADLAVALNVGYRRDGTSNILDPSERARLRNGDRLTLGLSDFDAVVLGAGASKRVGDRAELFGELGWDVLLGTNAPSAIESPLRVGAGSRYHLRPDLQLEGRLEVALSQRPAAPVLAPTEPRLGVILGVRWVLPFDKPPAEAKPPSDETTKPAEDVALALGSVQGHVKSETGAPIVGAQVTAASASGESRSAETGKDGAFTIADVTTGKVSVSAKAEGFDDAATEINVEAKKIASAELVMKRTIKPGQLRGLVRSYSGKPLAATIRVEPTGTEVKTDADGTFTIDVPPGDYEVSISAPGHAPQKRPVQVEENGVTVLNADLRPGTGK